MVTEIPDEDLIEEERDGDALQVEREESQGVELFEDPDAVLPAGALAEGSPGHEALTADGVELAVNDSEEERSDD